MTAGVRVAIVGCGLIGTKRASALRKDDNLLACHDVDPVAADTLARRFGCEVAPTLEDLLAREPDVVIVATPHHLLAETVLAALDAGANVLVEKPAATSSAQVRALDERAQETGRLVRVGFNHRFAPAIERAVTLAHSGQYGEIMFARGRYGHGGRPGYDREWRLQRSLSGGGELIDQGMHLIDIFHWLLGPLPLHSALLRTHFWDANVEDNAVLILGAGGERSAPWASAHVSWTEWKNMFSLEIYCRSAKLQVDGLWRSYGAPKLTIYAMRPELGPPDVEVIEFDAEDVSWQREWDHLRAALSGEAEGRIGGGLEDARYAWELVEEAYARG